MLTRNILTRLPLIIGLLFMLMLCNSCKKDISGECIFYVWNKVDKKIKVFFDGDKIGKVDANSTETWDVPSGRYLIKVTCSGLDPYEGYLTFSPNQRNDLIIEEEDYKSTKRIVIREQIPIQDL
jgi:hypothetical protein